MNMKKSEQINFLTTISQDVIKEMVDKINTGKVPAYWNGAHLRQWLRTKMESVTNLCHLTRSERRDFNNDLATNNL